MFRAKPGWIIYVTLAKVTITVLTALIFAQLRDPATKTDAALVIDGNVRQVFRSPRAERAEFLIQIEVQRCDARKNVRATARAAIPAPGDVAYIHVAESAGGEVKVPSEGAAIRAFINARERGGWEGVTGDWFEPRAEAAGSGAAPGTATTPSQPLAPAGLGMTAEALWVKERTALRVTSVERGGAAQKAGLEVGDVIVGANNAPVTSLQQIEELARKAEVITLVVVDVNTGQGATVELRGGSTPTAATKPADAPPGTGAAPAPTAPSRSLGISAEPVQLGSRTALKVLHVELGGAGAKAGLEPNDVLVAANGAALTSPEQLAAALRKSGTTLTLTVRDSRTGKDTPVEVKFADAKATGPLPDNVPVPAPSERAKGKLGVVTEFSFYDSEAAVKITEVEAGSAGARAGLQPGLIIIEANGKPMLHPNNLKDLERAGGVIKLGVVDPRTGRKANVEVNLGS